jgi:hypothetical protein
VVRVSVVVISSLAGLQHLQEHHCLESRACRPGPPLPGAGRLHRLRPRFPATELRSPVPLGPVLVRYFISSLRHLIARPFSLCTTGHCRRRPVKKYRVALLPLTHRHVATAKFSFEPILGMRWTSFAASCLSAQSPDIATSSLSAACPPAHLPRPTCLGFRQPRGRGCGASGNILQHQDAVKALLQFLSIRKPREVVAASKTSPETPDTTCFTTSSMTLPVRGTRSCNDQPDSLFTIPKVPVLQHIVTSAPPQRPRQPHNPTLAM